jgi:N-sulfoglucosamine sulfohydrolase
MNGKLNIIYLHSHDTGRYISPYGYKVRTHNLQRFAEEGVVFRQCFCANPTCSPSRAALLTGEYAHSCGMYGLVHRGFEMPDYSKL